MRRHLRIILALFAILAPSTMWGHGLEGDGICIYGHGSVAVTTGQIRYTGDVNADQEVNIADVNAAIDAVLGGYDTSAADVNSDGEVTIADINTLIDIILNGGTPTPQSPDYVDLGLPSGTLWATTNVGASAPEDYGDYFAWGETAPKFNYTWNTYKLCTGNSHGMIKYCTDGFWGCFDIVDDKTELEPDDDAAHVNWGPLWRMPSQEQMEELCEQCNWQDTTRNGVNGLLVTGPNGNTLFLPKAGYHYYQFFHDAETYGYYWTRTLDATESIDAHILRLSGGWHMFGYTRYFGLSVRPVRAH